MEVSFFCTSMLQEKTEILLQKIFETRALLDFVIIHHKAN